MREGSVLRGRYRLDELLGRGGMADVYLAFDLHRQAHIAIKVLREDLAEDPDFVRRFEHEAAALARLDHPNIVRFYSFEHDGPLAFIVMDYVAGTTLQRLLRELEGQPLPIEEITAVLRQVGSALYYAHREGYVHRDVKAGNIMLREDGAALLSDFGIARAAESITMTLGPVGTLPYMSPEQILGQRVDARSDIYSLGIVLFEMATGRRPFSGDEGTGTSRMERVRDAHLHVEPPNPRVFNPGLPEAAAAVILRALAKSPEHRFQDVTSLVQAWEDALGLVHELPAGGRPLGTVELTPRPKTERPPSKPPGPAPIPSPRTHPGEEQGRTRRGLWVAIAAVVLLGGVAALFLTLSGSGAAFQLGTAFQPAFAVRPPSPTDTTVPTATATPILPTPDVNATAQVLAGKIATETAQARETLEAIIATRAAATAQAIAGTATSAAAETAAAIAAETATAIAARNATATASARGTQEALARAATRTAEAEATAAAQATATRSAQETAQAKAAAAATSQAATAQALSRQRPGLVFDFERDITWRRGNQPYGQFSRSAEQVKAGSTSGRLQYSFPAVADNYVVFMPRPALPIPGQATGIVAWVYGDGSGHYLNAWVQDADGEIRSYTFGRLQYQGWQQIAAWLDEQRPWPNGHIGGPNDGRLRYPVSLYALVLDGVPDGQASSGVIYLDELFSTQDAIPAPAPTQPPYMPAAPAPPPYRP